MNPPRFSSVATAAVGGMFFLASAYLAALSLSAATETRRQSSSRNYLAAPAPRIVVLVPAHDEARLITRCLGSLFDQDYPDGSYQVVVIADNCTDNTAQLARDFGSRVLERSDSTARGKGHALRWAMNLLLRDETDLDAIVVVDADSVADRAMLAALADALVHGAEVAQADYGALVDGEDDRAQLRAAAFLLFHRVRFTGKAQLHLPCNLVGNGMLFSRHVLEQHPWSAFSEVEDLEYTIHLRLAGVRPTFVPAAGLVAPVVSAGPGAQIQRRRWEGGRLRLTRQELPLVLRRITSGRRLELWDLAADLAVPPLGVLAAGAVGGSSLAFVLRLAGRVSTASLATWSAALAAVGVHVIVGLRTASAPPTMMRALRGAPRLVVSEMAERLHALRATSGGTWVRTPRA